MHLTRRRRRRSIGTLYSSFSLYSSSWVLDKLNGIAHLSTIMFTILAFFFKFDTSVADLASGAFNFAATTALAGSRGPWRTSGCRNHNGGSVRVCEGAKRDKERVVREGGESREEGK